MHRNDRIPSQPESPTYDPSASPSRPVRRNLFSGHLSRRPASSQQSQSPTHSQSPINPPPPGPFTLSRPPLPSARSISQNSPFASPPHLPPVEATRIQLPSYGGSFMADTYDPAISPNRAISPGTAEVLFSSSSIVAMNPITGRPLLPTLPTLPRRLRLVDDDEEEEGEEGEDDEEADTEPEDHTLEEPQRSHNPRRAQPHHNDPFASSHPQRHAAAYAHASSADAAEETPYCDEEAALRYERERLDTLLSDMMTRYRSRRAQTSLSSISSSSHLHSHSQSLHSLRARHKSKLPADTTGAERERARQQEEQEEKDELMGHLLAKLRGEVVRAEEEGWMFGEGGIGRELEEMGEGGEGGGYGYGAGGGGGVNSQGGMVGGVGEGGGGREEVVINE